MATPSGQGCAASSRWARRHAGHCLGRRAKRREGPVSVRTHEHSFRSLDRAAKDAMVRLENGRERVAEKPKESRRAFDVGEQEGDRSRRNARRPRPSCLSILASPVAAEVLGACIVGLALQGPLVGASPCLARDMSSRTRSTIPASVARTIEPRIPTAGRSWYHFGTDCYVQPSRSSTPGDDGDAHGRIYTEAVRLGAERSRVQISPPRLVEGPLRKRAFGISGSRERGSRRAAVVPAVVPSEGRSDLSLEKVVGSNPPADVESRSPAIPAKLLAGHAGRSSGRLYSRGQQRVWPGRGRSPGAPRSPFSGRVAVPVATASGDGTFRHKGTQPFRGLGGRRAVCDQRRPLRDPRAGPDRPPQVGQEARRDDPGTREAGHPPPGRHPSATSAEVQISNTCDFNAVRCIGRHYAFSPREDARLVIADRPGATGGRHATVIAQADSLRCRQRAADRNHHCVLVFPPKPTTIRHPRQLPCRPGACHLNLGARGRRPAC